MVWCHHDADADSGYGDSGKENGDKKKPTHGRRRRRAIQGS